jgi:hypothetical protein
MSEKWLEDQRLNYQRYEIRAYLTNLFRKLPNRINTKSKNRKVLELGAGSWQLTDFLNEDNILKLDIIKMPGINIQADIYKTPIKNSVVDEIILVDVFHHLGKPWVFLRKATGSLKVTVFLFWSNHIEVYFRIQCLKSFTMNQCYLTRNIELGK